MARWNRWFESFSLPGLWRPRPTMDAYDATEAINLARAKTATKPSPQAQKPATQELGATGTEIYGAASAVR